MKTERRKMLFGTFTCVVVLQYYKTQDRRKQSDGKPVVYKHCSNEMYILKEEEDTWDKVKKKYDNKKATISIKDKSIKLMHDMGYSLADKEGNLIT
jgi:hypothetical protein